MDGPIVKRSKRSGLIKFARVEQNQVTKKVAEI